MPTNDRLLSMFLQYSTRIALHVQVSVWKLIQAALVQMGVPYSEVGMWHALKYSNFEDFKRF